MLEHLNEYSVDFARALFAEHPWLQAHARIVEENALSIEFCPPHVPKECPLWISTEDEEVSIGFGCWHAHHEWPVEGEDSDAPLEFLRDLFADRIFIVDGKRNGEWVGGTTCSPGEEPDLYFMPEGTEVRVRSWSGEHDRGFVKEDEE